MSWDSIAELLGWSHSRMYKWMAEHPDDKAVANGEAPPEPSSQPHLPSLSSSSSEPAPEPTPRIEPAVPQRGEPTMGTYSLPARGLDLERGWVRVW